MKVQKTALEGVLLLEPKVFSDVRGSFYESWRSAEYKSYGIQETFVQDNYSFSTHAVLRGLHYQKGQGQLVTIVYGEVWDVVVDLRKESSTFGKYVAFELSFDRPQQLYMPPGCAHGFCVLSGQAIIGYKCTQYYMPSEEGGIIWNDPDIAIAWPYSNSIVGQKDKELPSLKEYLKKGVFL